MGLATRLEDLLTCTRGTHSGAAVEALHAYQNPFADCPF
jgi:hypothetical protein